MSRSDGALLARRMLARVERIGTGEIFSFKQRSARW